MMIPGRDAMNGHQLPGVAALSVGETYDFEFTPQVAGPYMLRVRTNFSSDPAAEAVAVVQVR